MALSQNAYSILGNRLNTRACQNDNENGQRGSGVFSGHCHAWKRRHMAAVYRHYGCSEAMSPSLANGHANPESTVRYGEESIPYAF